MDILKLLIEERDRFDGAIQALTNTAKPAVNDAVNSSWSAARKASHKRKMKAFWKKRREKNK